MVGRPPPRDPLGKRALFWLPLEDPDQDAPPARRWFAPAVAEPPAPGRAGKRSLYSAPPDAGRRLPPAAGDAPEGRGLFAVTCSSCRRTTAVGPLQLVILHAPVAAFVPFRPFDHWMRCPACRRRTWTGVTLAR